MAQDSHLNEDIFFQLIVKCPSEKLQKLVHLLIDVFCGQKNVSYEEFSDVYSLIEWWDLTRGSQQFFLRYQSSNDELPGFSSLSQECQTIVKDSLNLRSNDLKNRLIERTHEISPAYLHDFDWKVKLTLASDKMAQINEPRLLLNLDISGSRKKSFCLDLSKEELKSLIAAMEKANKALQEFLINE